MATKAKAKAKKSDKSGKDAKASKKSKKDPAAGLTGLERYRALKAAGKLPPKKGGAKKKAGAAKKEPLFKAPAEFKPFFCRVGVKIAKDGLVTDMRVVRIKGSPTNENAKTVDMALYDPETLVRLAARYSGPAFIRNMAKRFPASSSIQFLLRVGMKKDGGTLTCGLKEFRLREKDAKKAKLLEKSDPVYRAARKAARWLPAAFVNAKPFPSTAELKAWSKADDDEGKVRVKSKKKKSK